MGCVEMRRGANLIGGGRPPPEHVGAPVGRAALSKADKLKTGAKGALARHRDRAMSIFMISFVPAKIFVGRASAQIWAIGYSFM